MGCVIANISSQRLDPDMAVESKRIGIEITVSSQISETLPKVTSSIARNTVDINSLRIGTLPLVTSSIVCDVGVRQFVKWALESLQWLGEDNQVGVTKYNKLIASGEWSLEELEIEELL